jgi:hypothetical protein
MKSAPWPQVIDPSGALTAQAIQDNFDALFAGGLETGDRQIAMRFGVSNATYPGGTALGSALVVPHGLGRTPVAVVATGKNGTTQGVVAVETEAYSATTFTLRVQDVSGVARAAGWTVPVAWIAVG